MMLYLRTVELTEEVEKEKKAKPTIKKYEEIIRKK